MSCLEWYAAKQLQRNVLMRFSGANISRDKSTHFINLQQTDNSLFRFLFNLTPHLLLIFNLRSRKRVKQINSGKHLGSAFET